MSVRRFDGVDDYVNFGSKAILDNIQDSNVSWVVWMRREGNNPSNVASRVIVKGSTPAPLSPFGISTSGDVIPLSITCIESRTTTNRKRQSTGNTVTNDVWTLLSATVIASTLATDMRLYVGSAGYVKEATYFSNGTNGVGITSDNSAMPMTAGAQFTAIELLGRIGYASVYSNKILSLNELSQLMYYPGSISDGKHLVGCWPLWGTPTEQDFSGYDNASTSISGTTILGDNPPVNGFGMVHAPIPLYG